ncbi:hypothetical protein L1887_32149 [Cichorium endivia]|nr:hypothetical protein L1887_32149 [Cichorium endivia]
MQRLPPPSPPYLFSIAPSHPFLCDFKVTDLISICNLLHISSVSLYLDMQPLNDRHIKQTGPSMPSPPSLQSVAFTIGQLR